MSFLLVLAMLLAASMPMLAYADLANLPLDGGNNGVINVEQMANLMVSNNKIEAGQGLEITANDLDIDILKSIYLNLSNFTDSTSLRVYWKTDAIASYSKENSYVFKTEKTPEEKKDDESYDKVYDLVLKGIDSFTGTLKGLRFEAEGATEGYMQIKELRLLPTLRQQMYYAGSIDSLKILDDKKTVELKGSLNGEYVSDSGKIKLYELAIWEKGASGRV